MWKKNVNTIKGKGLRQDSLTSPQHTSHVPWFINMLYRRRASTPGLCSYATLPCVVALTYYNPTTETRRGRVDDLIQSVQSFSNFDVRPVYVIYPWQTPLLLPLCWRLDVRLHAVRLRGVYTSMFFFSSSLFWTRGWKRGGVNSSICIIYLKQVVMFPLRYITEMCSMHSYWMQY